MLMASNYYHQILVYDEIFLSMIKSITKSEQFLINGIKQPFWHISTPFPTSKNPYIMRKNANYRTKIKSQFSDLAAFRGCCVNKTTITHSNFGIFWLMT